MDAPLVIRASACSAFADCQLRAAAQSQPRLFEAAGWSLHPARTNFGALIGSGVHAGAEVALKGRMQGALPPVSACEDAAIEELHRRRQAEGERGVIGDETCGDPDQAERQVRRMLGRYRTDVAERAEPVAVERRIEADIMPGVVLSGQSDLLHLERGGERAEPVEIVRDLKSTRRRGQHPMTHAPQVGNYSLLFRSRGYDPTACAIDLLPRVKLAASQPPVFTLPLDLRDAESIAYAVTTEFASKLLAFKRDGEPGRFLTNPASFLCSAKFCRLYGQQACPATRHLNLPATGAPS